MSSDSSVPGPGPDEVRNPWRRVQRSVVYENPWIRVYHDDVIRPDGDPGIYGVVHYRNLAVGVVVIDRDDRVLLVGQYRYPLDRYSWEIPSGGCPEGEEPVATAHRELQEETGYTAKSMRLILRAHLSNAVGDEDAYCYLAEEITPGPASPEGTEELSLAWVEFSNVLDRIAAGEITDSITIMAMQHIALERLRSSLNTRKQ